MAKSDSKKKSSPDQGGYGMVVVPQVFHAITLKAIGLMEEPDIDGLTIGLEHIAQKTDEELASYLKSVLLGQFAILDAAFNTFTNIASQRQPIEGQKIFAELALKSQNQARRTAISVADLVSPKRTTFIRQQNIASNQQVNNYASSDCLSNPECEIPKNLENIPANELMDMESEHEQWLDTRTTQKTV